jgi:hypothetical protein
MTNLAVLLAQVLRRFSTDFEKIDKVVFIKDVRVIHFISVDSV